MISALLYERGVKITEESLGDRSASEGRAEAGAESEREPALTA